MLHWARPSKAYTCPRPTSQIPYENLQQNPILGKITPQDAETSSCCDATSRQSWTDTSALSMPLPMHPLLQELLPLWTSSARGSAQQMQQYCEDSWSESDGMQCMMPERSYSSHATDSASRFLKLQIGMVRGMFTISATEQMAEGLCSCWWPQQLVETPVGECPPPPPPIPSPARRRGRRAVSRKEHSTQMLDCISPPLT